MKWFRLYSEFATDPKLGTFPKSQRYDLICLLCLANEAKERGVIRLDAEDIAAALDMEEGEYEAFLRKLERKGIVETRDDGALEFTNWLERQYDKPSDRPDRVSERVKKHRTQPAQECNAPETPCNAPETPYTNTQTQRRGENTQKREEAPLPPEGAAEAPAARAGGAASRFVDAFRAKSGGADPDNLTRYAKLLADFERRVGRARYERCLTGFFTDTWASEQGFSASCFLGQTADRWDPLATIPRSRASPPARSGRDPTLTLQDKAAAIMSRHSGQSTSGGQNS